MIWNEILHEDPNLKLEILMDRLMYRPVGRKPGAESWHRDQSPEALDDDIIYGGWVNFDDFPHTLSCCPRTHLDRNDKGGFNKISKEDTPYYKAKKKHIFPLTNNKK